MLGKHEVAPGVVFDCAGLLATVRSGLPGVRIGLVGEWFLLLSRYSLIFLFFISIFFFLIDVNSESDSTKAVSMFLLFLCLKGFVIHRSCSFPEAK